MQYMWHKGDKIFAGGLFTDVTYVFDTSQLPELKLKGVNLPTDTLCGSVPDAYWVIKDGTAYGTYMGGPDVPGPCTYTDGRPGSATASPARPASSSGSTRTARPSARRRRPRRTAGDRAALRQHPGAAAADLREPARHPGPRGPRHPGHQRLQRAAQHHPQPGVGAVVVPASADRAHLGHLRPGQPEAEGGVVPARRPARGQGAAPGGAAGGHGDHGHQPARAQGRVRQTMQGGAIYYTPDITAAKPQWREVFDLTTSNKQADPSSNYYGGGSNGGWLQTSLDDKYLYHAVVGRPRAATTTAPRRTSSCWTSRSCWPRATTRQCSIDTLDEVTAGGAESDCPAVVEHPQRPRAVRTGARWTTSSSATTATTTRRPT